MLKISVLFFTLFLVLKCFRNAFDFIGDTFHQQRTYRIFWWHIATNKNLFLQPFGKLLCHFLWIASHLSAQNGCAGSVGSWQSHCHFVECLIFAMSNVDEHRLIHLQHPKVVFHFGYVGTEQMTRPFARHLAHDRCSRFHCWHSRLLQIKFRRIGHQFIHKIYLRSSKLTGNFGVLLVTNRSWRCLFTSDQNVTSQKR